MKKILALILLLACFVNSIALADSFTLRNGVLFGDTMETVKGKEDLKYINEGKKLYVVQRSNCQYQW